MLCSQCAARCCTAVNHSSWSPTCTRRRREEEEEEAEGLFKADAVNEEDPKRDRATQVEKTWRRRRRPPPSFREERQTEARIHSQEVEDGGWRGGGWRMGGNGDHLC